MLGGTVLSRARLNPALERTLGFTVEEMMARPMIDFVHPDDRDRTLPSCFDTEVEPQLEQMGG